jgi:hypothetical protein
VPHARQRCRLGDEPHSLRWQRTTCECVKTAEALVSGRRRVGTPAEDHVGRTEAGRETGKGVSPGTAGGSENRSRGPRVANPMPQPSQTTLQVLAKGEHHRGFFPRCHRP